MSQRYYSGPSPSRGPGPLVTGVAWALALVTIALQIAFPLVPDSSRAAMAIAIVLSFFAASVVHAAARHGILGFLLVGFAVPAIGLAAEAVGVRTGLPFGDYTYGDSLGVQLFHVPAVVPLAWAMMAYPTYVAAATLSRSRWWTALIGGWSLMAWDLFLDPMMVDLGGWRWLSAKSAIPGIPGIPLQNFAGWFLVGVVITALLTLLPPPRASVAQPATLYLWVYASSVVGNAVFFDRPHVAWIGAVAMGVVAAPFAWRVWDGRT